MGIWNPDSLRGFGIPAYSLFKGIWNPDSSWGFAIPAIYLPEHR